jgi:hypothetical protein
VLLRHGLHYQGEISSKAAHERDLGEVPFAHPAQHIVYADCRIVVHLAWRLVTVELAVSAASCGSWLNRKKLREVRRREGRHLLRTNLTESDPAKL